MKKQIRTIIIATIVTCAIILSCACAMPAQAEQKGEFYPKLAIVVNVKQVAEKLWVVECEDRTGNMWSFFDDMSAWAVGDIANLLMWNLGENEEEDEIIEVYWEGYAEDMEMFFQTVEWH